MLLGYPVLSLSEGTSLPKELLKRCVIMEEGVWEDSLFTIALSVFRCLHAFGIVHSERKFYIFTHPNVVSNLCAGVVSQHKWRNFKECIDLTNDMFAGITK